MVQFLDWASSKPWDLQDQSSSLEPMQIVSLNSLPSLNITQALSYHRISKIENGSFSELGLIKESPCSVFLPEATLLYMAHAISVCSSRCCQKLCCCPSSMMPLESMLMSIVHVITRNHVDVSGLC